MTTATGTDAVYVEPRPVADEAERALARSLTLRVLLTSTVFFLVAGVLGATLRYSQVDIGRLDDNLWYAFMTAHGLGAFVGWAAFAVMGAAWWVLAEVGFPLGRFGGLMARATFWLMVIGVLGVVVTTVFLQFGASWVFLYPLPFHPAGEWSEAVTGVFSASVLVVGLSIITWCLGIIGMVVGPALHAVAGSRLLNRMGTATGLGLIFPARFRTNPTPVPYPVIPLAVIAIDMIIATLPFAALLVEMIIQSITPSVSVDPLLAKNMLWFFGHPVVYLLLFPAVAIYYLLVPRLAGRPLVAGNIIAVGWTIALIANVLVWAHHIYLDYPEGTVQAALNVPMQPMTFLLTVVSALSLYSLFLTIFRSNWQWTAASTALFLGLVSWLLSGLSGVVNATIAFDSYVHNTLWIVGHFHHMALLNIGLVVFAAIYAFLPQLLNRPLYSDALGRWHIWLTFVFGTANSIIWLVQGLDGAPRRFSVLPENYDDLSAAAIPIVTVLGLVQLLFVWNVVQTMRGRTTRATGLALLTPVRSPVPRTSFAGQGLVVVVSVGVAFGLAAAGWAIGDSRGPSQAAAAGPGQVTPAQTGPGGGNVADGKQVFASAGCAGCHTLEAAGATGTVGPNLDQSKPSLALALNRVRNGGGAMPAFQGQLTDAQIQDVASFVVVSTQP